MAGKNPRDNIWSVLPDRVFISHSYADVEDKNKLLEHLHGQTHPVVFPRREPDPQNAVSNGIVKKILSCPGLIYLEGGQSRDSLWVNFERDYALRSGREVFSFDATTGILRRDMGQPVPIQINVIVGADREHRVEALFEWMKRERFFDFQADTTRVSMDEIPELVAEVIREERIVVWFLDSHIAAEASFAMEVQPEMLHACFGDSDNYKWSDLENYADWLRQHSMYVRIDPEWQPARAEDSDIEEFILEEYQIEKEFFTGWAVDLVSKDDERQIDWNRADDLIVRSTFMVQNSKPFSSE